MMNLFMTYAPGGGSGGTSSADQFGCLCRGLRTSSCYVGRNEGGKKVGSHRAESRFDIAKLQAEYVESTRLQCLQMA